MIRQPGGGKSVIVRKLSAGAIVNVFEVEGYVIGLEWVFCEETGDEEFAIVGVESIEKCSIAVLF